MIPDRVQDEEGVGTRTLLDPRPGTVRRRKTPARRGVQPPEPVGSEPAAKGPGRVGPTAAAGDWVWWGRGKGTRRGLGRGGGWGGRGSGGVRRWGAGGLGRGAHAWLALRSSGEAVSSSGR